jgi:hypothetical protein
VVQGHTLYANITVTLPTPHVTCLVHLAAQGLPPGASVSFPDIPSSHVDAHGPWLYFGANQTTQKTAVALTTTAATPPGTYTFQVVAHAGSALAAGPVQVTVQPVPTAPAPQPLNLTPIPDLAQWEANMVNPNYGPVYASPARIKHDGTWEGGVWYYDGARVFYQIADYSHNHSWDQYAQNVLHMYRDQYVLPAQGKIGGWRVFAEGLAMDYLRTHNPLSKQALDFLVTNSPYAAPLAPVSYYISPASLRENAYVIDTYLAAMEIGEPANPQLLRHVDVALGQLDQLFVTKTYPEVLPFMVGLVSEALIRFEQATGDARVLPALQTAADWLWNNAWMPVGHAFYYCTPGTVDNLGAAKAAPDLNLLICPLYAWLYRQTGDVKYRDEGDQAFAGGVTGAWLGDGKHFSQNYRWSFDYVHWRSAPA